MLHSSSKDLRQNLIDTSHQDLSENLIHTFLDASHAHITLSPLLHPIRIITITTYGEQSVNP